MANPNIVAVTEIYGKTAFLPVTTTTTSIVENSSSSNKILKINSLIIANVGQSSSTITVDILRGATPTHVIKSVSVEPSTAFTAIDKSVLIYLEEGDSLRLTAQSDLSLEAICSYEEII